EPFDEPRPFGNKPGKQHFRIAVIPELPSALQLDAEILVVVNLAVEHQHPASGWITHRLVAAGKVDDRQPGLPCREIAISEAGSFVRPAMFEALQCCDHALAAFRG